MTSKVHILLYSFTTLMKKEIRKRFSFIIRKSIHRKLKVESGAKDVTMSAMVEAGIIIATEKSKVEINKILELE